MSNRNSNGAELPPADSVGFLIRDTMMHLHKVLRARLSEHDISTAQWFLLRVLWEEEGLSQRELSDRVSTTEPTTQSALLRMEKQGIIRRERNKSDRRANHIYLTKKGRDLEPEMIPYAMNVNELASHGLSKTEIKTFKDIIGRMRNNLLDEIHKGN
ncbi:MAG: MarR family transcriptional regulator [Rhodospirillales bacterium]|nr:MarR family transcriptional regulator [Rhodospirillales bacterium]